MRIIAHCAVAALLSLVSPAWAEAPAGVTLAKVKARGILECSASLGSAGFGLYDRAGVFQGLDADTCRAVAAAVLGTPSVRFLPVSQPAAPGGAANRAGGHGCHHADLDPVAGGGQWARIRLRELL